MEGEKKRWFQTLRSYQYVALVVAAGVLLMLWPERGSPDGGGETAPPSQQQRTLEETRREMEEILSAIEGAGRLRLMLTLETMGEKQLAGDSSLRYRGTPASPDDYERRSEPVVVARTGSGQDVVVTQELTPRFRGALVVCDGGNIDSVRLAVTEAVSVLTGLGADKISVVKFKQMEVPKG